MTPAGNYDMVLDDLLDQAGSRVEAAPGSGYVVSIPVPDDVAATQQLEYGLLLRYLQPVQSAATVPDQIAAGATIETKS